MFSNLRAFSEEVDTGSSAGKMPQNKTEEQNPSQSERIFSTAGASGNAITYALAIAFSSAAAPRGRQNLPGAWKPLPVESVFPARHPSIKILIQNELFQNRHWSRSCRKGGRITCGMAMALTSILGETATAALPPARANAPSARPREQVFTVPDEPSPVRAASTQMPAPATNPTAVQSPPNQPAIGDAPDSLGKDHDKKAATETATAGTGGDTALAVTVALAGAAETRATPQAAGTATTAGGAPADAKAAGATQDATTAAAPANLIVGASGKAEKIAADLGASATAKTDQPATDAKAAAAKPAEANAKLATPAKADQATDAKPETPAAKPEATAKRKDAADAPAAKTGDQTAAAQASAAATSPVAKAEAGADAARAAAAAAPAPQNTLPPTPLQTVPIEIGLQALRNGSSTFQIRLDPEELGRIEVKLHISGDSKVSASLVVDRVETLHMLQREAKTLERAFEQAGLKSNGDDLQFSLRQDGRGQNGGSENGQNGSGRPALPLSSDEDMAVTPRPAVLQRLTMTRALAGGLDIQI